MKKNVIGYCPVCNEKLIVKTLKCNKCDTEITGEFQLSPFDYLKKEQLEFALMFIKCQGNIKELEKALNVSYPTVKKNIDELCVALGFKADIDLKEDVKRRLKNKEITFEEAEEILGGLK